MRRDLQASVDRFFESVIWVLIAATAVTMISQLARAIARYPKWE